MLHNNSKTLSDFGIVDDNLLKTTFNKLTEGKTQLNDLRLIFAIALKDKSLFPNINLEEDANYKKYLERWIKGYEDATLHLPSQRIANPKSSCSDPAIKAIVKYATKVDDRTAEQQNDHHNLYMSAENIQGNLLEEYIATHVRTFGWLWCKGNVLRAIDFCALDGSVLLQIKNKSNTENSSSSAIRAGTSIKKWYRLGTKIEEGNKVPDYKWKDLNLIINSISKSTPEKCTLSEESYQDFLKTVATKNPKIITSK